MAAIAVWLVAQPLAQEQKPVFRSSRNIVSVDVIVRDRSGAVVRGLTASDFEIREDGRPQEILSFTFEQIADRSMERSATVSHGDMQLKFAVPNALSRFRANTFSSKEPETLEISRDTQAKGALGESVRGGKTPE